MSADVGVARRPCLYFTRLTVSEEGAYFPADARARTQLISESRDIPAVAELLDGYRDILDVDLFGELNSFASPRADKRAFETGIYAAAAYCFERSSGVSPTCLAFYSSGVAPALLFSGVVSPSTYLRELLPFHDRNRECYAASACKVRLAQVRLEGDCDEDIETFIAETIRKHAFERRVYLKDRRGLHTTLIGGEEKPVLLVREAVCEQFPSVLRRGAVLRLNEASAHLPFYDTGPLVQMLDGMRLSPPRFTLIGVAGERVPAGCGDQEVLRNLVIEAALGLLDTGRALRVAAEAADQLVIIGSRRGAYLLERPNIDAFGSFSFAFAEAAPDAAAAQSRKRSTALESD
ncbi:hypothetical protein [Bradyrhizobium sp. Gha]|uniref:hypothetical protein n=1 Tax=Bradyrhizobium sp. Gha TaxID=1855318 RepID=UPI0008E2EC2F|nr:hypothetical protein [Bradyrhizobium sp. Gha]SFI25140.1 hypothetical protein SAMN05216525_106158 [Bradyrhizobium sp. Gha]